MIGFILPLILSILFGKVKESSKRRNVSALIKHEKLLNVISTGIMLAGFIYSIFLPLQLGKVWFFIGFIIFLLAIVISLSATFITRTISTDKLFINDPYRYLRYPLYAAETLILISIIIACVYGCFCYLH